MLTHPVFLARLTLAGFGLSILLMVLDFLAFFVYQDTFFYRLFIATKEQTPLTWLSAIAFFLLGLGAWYVAWRDRSRLWGWFALVFMFFSLDDAIYLHERIAGYFRDHVLLFQDFPSYIWMILYLPLLITSLGFLLVLLWRHRSRIYRPWVILAFAFLALSAILDFSDGLVQREAVGLCRAETACRATLLHLMRLAEELLEVWAIGLLGYLVFQTYASESSTQ